MPISTAVAAITMPYQNFLSELAKSVQVYGTALATIVLIVCAFGYMGAKGLSPQNASRWMGGMFAAVFAAIVCVGAPSIVTIVEGWAANAA
jgi:heme/copper-type cytochrome/quinol oxidase subunit 4